MAKHIKLYTPGPGDVDEEVLAEAAQPVLRHYGPEWMEIHNELLGQLRQFFGTRNDIFVVPGPTSALLDMAIGSLTQRGEKIIVGTNGFFGDRLIDMAEGYGLSVIPFTAQHGEPLDPEDLRHLLAEHPDARVVAVVHHETGTTVMNPLRELARVVQDAGRVIVVDAVSSLGGVDMQVDQWGVDVCVTGANKCLEALPGVGFISVSRRAWEMVDSHPGAGTGWYLNLRTWRKYAQEWGSWHPSPVTLPVNIILAVMKSMHRILEGGLENHYAKYRRASQTMRTRLADLGFEMLVPEAYASPIVTGVRRRSEFELAEFSQWLVTERGLAIGGGLGPLAGKIVRIGHLGKAAEQDYLDEFIQSVEDFLRYKDIPIPAGLTGVSEG